MRSKVVLAGLFAASMALSAFADTVTLINGDKITGTIGVVTPKALKFKSNALGEVTIGLTNIASYSFDAATTVQPKTGPAIVGPVSGDATTVKVGDTTYAAGELKSVNPPKQAWKGVVVANASLARGNTNKFTVGAEAQAELRRDDDRYDDRFGFNGIYNYGTSGGGPTGEPKVTDTDNWLASGKYDNFWSQKLYDYTSLRLEHDRIAILDYRVTPGVGLGYQWIETPKVTFSTEAGLSFIHEKFEDGESTQNLAARLAYRYDNRLSETVLLFHNLEYLPGFENPGDYILNTDIGLRANLTANLFAQLKILYKRDSTPADDALKNDLLYTVGVGWQF